jgi:hypothetical protein
MEQKFRPKSSYGAEDEKAAYINRVHGGKKVDQKTKEMLDEALGIKAAEKPNTRPAGAG